ncbi:(d)CMP kinase [Miltoncostaea oceani]|uniref:(d)CMP kinase n=1 Tax=Miltoncostaea oceani TaxID=2843216 RepID=UPI001C3DC93F|nr:(d)CMP kinase [Miltoncostaea oceani]
MIVAIDGPAGAGKSTVARTVARRLGVAYLDTGAMYRAITWLARERAVAPSDAAALAALARDFPIEIEPTDDGDRVRVDGRDVTREIRMPEVAADVSEVSAHPGVRDEVVAAQRALLAEGSWVSDGRDVGSVVCPHADVKVFLTATLEERARRRRADLARRGVEVDEATILEDVRRRDHLDSTRATSPLRVAEGAIVIDSSDLEADDVADLVVQLVRDLGDGSV